MRKYRGVQHRGSRGRTVVTKMRAYCGWYQYIQGRALFASPQDDPQRLKVGGSYMFNGRFCPDIYFCHVFILTIIKDTLEDKVLDIDCKQRKGNVRASSMRIGVISTKTLKQYAKRMHVSWHFRPPPFSLSKVAISRLEYE